MTLGLESRANFNAGAEEARLKAQATRSNGKLPRPNREYFCKIFIRGA